MSASINILDFFGGINGFVRIFLYLIILYPALVAIVVYLIRRENISLTAKFLAYSIVTGYFLNFAAPLAVILISIALGNVAEIAFMHSLLTFPVLIALPIFCSLKFAKKFES